MVTTRMREGKGLLLIRSDMGAHGTALCHLPGERRHMIMMMKVSDELPR